jgi:Ca-activated chloride channel family protein
MHYYEWLHALWLLPVAAAVYAYAFHRKDAALRALIREARLRPVMAASASRGRQIVKATLVLAALGLLVVALARPRWNPQPEQLRRMGRDVVFLVDVSRSMLAEDLAPNRLERAKIAIRDALNVLRGDRVALVAFAGSSVVKCPLTLDYGFFRMALEDLSTESVSRGGTLIGDAIRKAIEEVFDDRERQFKDIVLITDGEDHDSFPVRAAEKAGEGGVRLIAIGLGDENEGKRIPVTDASGRRTFLTHEGKEVWSRLDAETLRRAALASRGGKYVNVATGNIELDRIYATLIREAERREVESKSVVRYDEKYQLFLFAALAALLLEAFIGERKAA